MNTAEHIVESYFRLVCHCFTVTDVKIIGGVNRQCDLLAIDARDNNSYHVESTVTHERNWMPNFEKITKLIEHKFLGKPGDRPDGGGPNSDRARGVEYFHKILETYRSYGVNPENIKRVICVWDIKATVEQREKYLRDKEKEFNLPVESLSFLLFRDEVLPRLRNAVGTSNYDDEVLRTFSLLKQYERQTHINRP